MQDPSNGAKSKYLAITRMEGMSLLTTAEASSSRNSFNNSRKSSSKTDENVWKCCWEKSLFTQWQKLEMNHAYHVVCCRLSWLIVSLIWCFTSSTFTGTQHTQSFIRCCQQQGGASTCQFEICFHQYYQFITCPQSM